MAPALNDYLFAQSDPEVKGLLRQQWADATEQRKVTCGCGQVRALELAYRCLYCGVWFCAPCGEQHFGETVLQHKKRMRAERVKRHMADPCRVELKRLIAKHRNPVIPDSI